MAIGQASLRYLKHIKISQAKVSGIYPRPEHTTMLLTTKYRLNDMKSSFNLHLIVNVNGKPKRVFLFLFYVNCNRKERKRLGSLWPSSFVLTKLRF